MAEMEEEVDVAGQLGALKNIEQTISYFAREVARLEHARHAISREIVALQSALRRAVDLRDALLNAYPQLGSSLELPEKVVAGLAGQPLHEAMGAILRESGRPLSKDELAKLLSRRGFDLGRFPGRTLHLASIRSDNIKKARPGLYVYLPGGDRPKKQAEGAGT